MTEAPKLRNSRALTQVSQPGRTALIVGAVIVASAAIILGSASVYRGVRQMDPGLPPESIDCHYRAQLLRHRVLAHIDHPPPLEKAEDATGAELSTLIRETLTACEKTDPATAKQLGTIAAMEASRTRQHGSQAALRQEVSAL